MVAHGGGGTPARFGGQPGRGGSVGGGEAISVAGLGGGRPEVGRGVQGQAATMAGRCHLGSWRSGAVAALGRGGEDRQGRTVSARAEERQ